MITDDEIRKILIERKRKEKAKEARDAVLSWAVMFGGLYVLYMALWIGGAR